MRLRKLFVIPLLAASSVALFAGPAGASGETVGGCIIEKVEELEAEGLTLHDLTEVQLEELGDEAEACQEAPSPIIPELNEVIWGGGAFAVLFALMVWKGFPAVKGLMDERTAKIQADMDAADRSRTEAGQAQAELNAQLADAKQEANRIIGEARNSADAVKVELTAKAEQDIAELRQRAAADVEAARIQAVNDLRTQVSAIALGAAERVVGESLDRETQIGLIDRYIDEVANSNG